MDLSPSLYTATFSCIALCRTTLSCVAKYYGKLFRRVVTCPVRLYLVSLQHTVCMLS